MLFVINLIEVVLMAKLLKGSHKYLDIGDVLAQGQHKIHAAFAHRIVVKKFRLQQQDAVAFFACMPERIDRNPARRSRLRAAVRSVAIAPAPLPR